MNGIGSSADQQTAAGDVSAAIGTLVLGGTGKTGRRVAARLRARGLPVRIGSRSGAPPFVWEDPATWLPAVAGARSVYLVYSPDLSFPAAAAAVRSFSDLAVGAGVQRLVLLSQRGEDAVDPSEEAVRKSGAEWTILRPSWFSQNFSEGYLDAAVRRGEVALPAGSVAEPFLDADDIADVVVTVLTEDGHSGQVYDLTGPRLLTFAEAAAEIGSAAGREVRYQPLSPDAYASALRGANVPAEYVTLVTALIARGLDGHNAYLTDDVQRLLGRPPIDFTDYAQAAAATGVWSV